LKPEPFVAQGRESESLPAKLLPPTLPAVLRRTRLFRRLDAATPAIWIAAPAGAGKTTLAASWLEKKTPPALWYQLDARDADPAALLNDLSRAAAARSPASSALPRLGSEHAESLASFARRFFEEFYASLPRGTILILDNHHEIPADAPSQPIFAIALEVLPPETRALVLSRGTAPASLARLRASGRLDVLGWDDLRLTEPESAAIVKLRGRSSRSAAEVTLLHRTARGWMAGLVLLLERAGGLPSSGPSPEAPDSVFQYFASEMLAPLESDRRRFLLETALLPSMTVGMAEALTDERRAEEFLTELTQGHTFTEVRAHGARSAREFQYHPLFREFLLRSAERELEASDLATLRRRAGKVLAEGGRPDEACTVLYAAGAHAELASLLEDVGPRWLAEARSRTLEEWLSRLPQEILATRPWLLCWLGECRLVHEPRSAVLPFEQSYELFRAADDRIGALTAWCGVVESTLKEMGDFTSLDPWIDRIDELAGDDSASPRQDLGARFAADAVGVLSFRRPQTSTTMVRWSLRALDRLPHLADLRQRMLTGYHLTLAFVNGGVPAVAAALIEQLRLSAESSGVAPEARLTWRLAESVYHWSVGDPDRCLEAVADGTEIAHACGIGLLDFQLAAQGLCASLVREDLEAAASFHERMQPVLEQKRPLEMSEHHYLSAWLASARGETDLAADRLFLALRCAINSGAPFPIWLTRLALAHVEVERGAIDAAELWLDRAEAFTVAAERPFFTYRMMLARALCALEAGDEKTGLARLEEAFALGREHGLVLRHFWWQPRVLARLCTRALEAGIEAEHVVTLIKRFDLPLPDAALAPEAWPWPLRVRTLGGFAIERDGARVEFTGKAQKRPLELLKALIALGPRDVPLAQLADALWPDADGDAGQRALATTLHRLRRLLGSERVIVQTEGRVRVDPETCWVDAWHFEALLASRAEPRDASRRTKSRVAGLQRALAVYRGTFLEAEASVAWTVSARERLRARFLGAAKELARELEDAGSLDGAADCYSNALAVDDLAEDLYQGLMRCQQRAGRVAEAVATFERCRRTLRSGLGVEPSGGTRELFEKLRSAT